MESIKTLLSQINKFWASKDSRFKRIAIIIASGVLVVVIAASLLLNHVEYADLYSGLDSDDSAAVIAALADQDVAYRVTGSTIQVPAADADRLRLTLSSEVKGSFNLDILEKGQGLGLTESDKEDYRRYQIQSDIENSLETFNGVLDARAAITMGTDRGLVYDDNKQPATAAVIITLDDGVELSAEQINAIAGFVHKSVPGLTIENISLMDSNMNNLDIGGKDPEISTSDRVALQNDVQSKLRKQVMTLLQSIFGLGKVEAQVNVKLNFDEKIVDSVVFEPLEGSTDGVIASIEKLREQIVNSGESAGEPGTETNTGTTTYPVVSVDNGTYEKNSEKINYEITTIKSHLEQAKGSIENLSVAVVIDSTNLEEDYTDTVKELVAATVGVAQEFISVKSMPMNGSSALTEIIAQDNATKAAIVNNGQMRFYVILAAIVLLAVVGMVLVASAKSSKRKSEHALQVAALGPVASQNESEIDEMDESSLEGIMVVKESGTKEQIGKLIDSNPELVANLLRSWLAEEE